MMKNIEASAMVHFLERFSDHPFLIKTEDQEIRIGEGTPEFAVRVKKPLEVSKLAAGTSLALGEAYMDGDLEIEGNLYEALDRFLGQMGKFSTDRRVLKKLLYPSRTKRSQKKEVTSHYDIGNEFYKLWLDETMSYSCGYFKTPEDTLLQAQENKVEYILKKLCLKEDMELLDIGCGWGYLLLRAAKEYHVKGTGITLSEEQYRECRRRIQEEGLEGRVEVRLMDYRDMPSAGLTFDRVVSVGMAEHVGRGNYQLFIDCASSVLKDGGLFLLHFISGLKEYPGDPWIKKYIFPGGVVPSLREMLYCLAEDNFHTLDVENLRLHYNKTLLCWEKNYKEHIGEVEKMFDERFARMWELYLCSCAATFHNGIIDLHQILATKGINNELGMVRWY